MKKYNEIWKRIKNEIDEIGYIQSEYEEIYFIKNEIEKIEDESEREEFLEFLNEKIKETYILIYSDHAWLQQMLMAHYDGRVCQKVDFWTTETYAYYVTQEVRDKYDNLYEFIIKENLLYDDELEEIFREFLPEYFKTEEKVGT